MAGSEGEPLVATTLLISLLCLLLSAFITLVDSSCAGLDVPLHILPPGDNDVVIGQSLDLFCQLNLSDNRTYNRTAQDLSFTTLSEELEGKFNKSIVNNTTVKVQMWNLPAGRFTYYCCLSNTSGANTCVTDINVGSKPQEVKDFGCISMNWENLTCRWTPHHNFVTTKYTLEVAFIGRAARQRQLCPDSFDNTCTLTDQTVPHYRQAHEAFIFYLTSNNSLGNLTQRIHFNHFAHVIPNKPELLTVVNKTVSSVLLFWMVAHPMNNFPSGLHFKIEYRSQFDDDNDDWKVVNPGDVIKGVNHTYNISNLVFPHAAYDVRLYLKSSVAANDFPWSQPAATTFYTESAIPDSPPLTAVGSFDVRSQGNKSEVYIYWKKLPDSHENGANFSYHISCHINQKEVCPPPVAVTKSYAHFRMHDIRQHYTYAIYSVNEIGRSVGTSFVKMAPYFSVPVPESFTNVAYGGGLFELSWKHVKVTGPHKLSNYTIFWCEDNNRPLPCNGQMNWTDVNPTVAARNITLREDLSYKFAVSANLDNGVSSGMTWSSCVLGHNNVVQKIDGIHVSDMKAREVTVMWEFWCTQSSSLRGFMIYYCPVSLNKSCKAEEELEKAVMGAGVRTFVLDNLRPYTTYKLDISVIFGDENSVGHRKEGQRFTTLSDAPSSPLDLQVVSVTNTSAEFDWNPPLYHNGVLEKYILNCTGLPIRKIDAKNGGETHGNSSEVHLVRQFTLKNLTSHMKYICSLKACTNGDKCSTPSNNISLFTRIGVPGIITRFSVDFNSSSEVNISWDPPDHAGGPIDGFEVQYSLNDGEIKTVSFPGAKRQGVVDILGCRSGHSTTTFSIRAINFILKDGEAEKLFGPWSYHVTKPCGLSVWSTKLVLLMWVIGLCAFGLSVGVVSFVIKKGWLHCRKMKNFEVKLPAGLQSQELEKDNDYGWPPARTGEAIARSMTATDAPDEESLLEKQSDESLNMTQFNLPVKPGGDSSGCSVGRESGSSSIISDTHVSTDSGAEADRSIPGSTDHYSPGRRVNTLKGSHSKSPKGPKIPKTAPPTISDTHIYSDDGESLPLQDIGPPGYTKVGCTSATPMSETSLPGKGYVTIASVSTPAATAQGAPLQVISVAAMDTVKSPTVQKSPPPANKSSYVTIAHLQGLSLDPPSLRTMNGGTAISPTEASGSHEETDESSDNETDPETVMTVSNISGPMPPYVAVAGSDVHSPVEDLPSPSVTNTTKQSHYVPHHIFDKNHVNQS